MPYRMLVGGRCITFRGQKCEGSKFSREMCFRRSYVLMRSLRKTPSMRLLPKNSRDLSKLGLAAWSVASSSSRRRRWCRRE